MAADKNGRVVIPFNEFAEEQKRTIKPLVLPIGDDEYDFPGDMPAGVTLIFMAKMSEHGEDFDLDDLPLEEVIHVLESIKSPEEIRQMIFKHNLGTDALFWIYGWLLTYWTDRMPEAQSGNAPERLEKLSTSSKAGRSSKRTSSVTTG